MEQSNRASPYLRFYETGCQSFALLWLCDAECQSFALLWFCDAECQSFALSSCHRTKWQNFTLSSCHGADCQRLTLQSMTSLKRLGTLVKGLSQAVICLATPRLPVEHYKNWTRHQPFDDTSSCRERLIWTSQTASPLDKSLFEELTLPQVIGDLRKDAQHL